MAAPYVAVVNSDSTFLRMVDGLLKQRGYETILLSSGSVAYDSLRDRHPDLIILDTWLETREQGWALLQSLKLDAEMSEIPVLLCSSDPTEIQSRASNLEKFENLEVMIKPFRAQELLEKITQLLGRAG